MRGIKLKILALSWVAAVCGWQGLAMAALPAPTSQSIKDGLGSSTSGSETGLFELQAALETAVGVLSAMVIICCGFVLVRNFIGWVLVIFDLDFGGRLSGYRESAAESETREEKVIMPDDYYEAKRKGLI